MEIEATLPDGRPRCPAETRKGQCKSTAGYRTEHEGTGPCMYHDNAGPRVEMLAASGQPLVAPKQQKAPKLNSIKAEREHWGLDRWAPFGVARALLRLRLEAGGSTKREACKYVPPISTAPRTSPSQR